MLFFRNKTKTDPYAVIYEKWATSFGFLDKKRFTCEKTDSYESGIENNRFSLSLKKKNHFAWILSELYRYNDFCLEAAVQFGENNPYSSLGFLFRYINDENFYYFLISNKGFFRFDVVFNGTPMTRIDWTEFPNISSGLHTIRIIARSTFFAFFINDEWVAEIDDDIFFEGRIGFAAQNYDERPDSVFYLNNFLVDSRPLFVEKQYERWVNYIPVEPAYRIRLAKTFYAMDEFPAATIQMKKALRNKKPDAEDFFFFGEMCVNMNMYDIALESMEKALALDSSLKLAIQEKGNILYLQNRFIEARDFIMEYIPLFGDNAPVWNLLGNCEYTLGNWQKSLEAYEKACGLQNDMPLFLENAARASEMIGNKEKALEYHIKASNHFFRQEAYGELYTIFSRVKKLDLANAEVQALEAKLLFQEQRFDEAEKIFNQLIEKGTQDSGVYYLNGIISSTRGEREKAISLVTKACELEDTFFLYWLKIGELKFHSGMDPEHELKKALDLAPENPWVLNQYGLYLFEKKDYEQAKEYFLRAHRQDKNESDFRINLSLVLFELGKKDEAFRVLESENPENNHRILNHKGNLHVRDRDFSQAIKAYEKALRLDPENPAYLENCAKTCIEVDMIMQAEEYLVKLFDIAPTPPVYNLIGYLALIQRDWIRAEIAFREGLEKDPDNRELLLNLASMYLDRLDYVKAKEHIEKLLKRNSEDREALRILSRIREKTEIELNCAQCRRIWRVAKNIPIQSIGKIHGEPPSDAPAGKCEKCGKVYCVGCAQEHLKENRFYCPDCDEFLKLSDNYLKYLLIERLKQD